MAKWFRGTHYSEIQVLIQKILFFGAKIQTNFLESAEQIIFLKFKLKSFLIKIVFVEQCKVKKGILKKYHFYAPFHAYQV